MRVAVPATVVRGQRPDRAPPLHHLARAGVFDELHRRSSIGSVPAGTWTGPPRPTHRPPRRCRLTIRYEHHGENFAAFLRLAAASTCFEKLAE
ncbi:hypothetical protein NJ76_03205 [Rhodococcus sp. IITR03]|nr:hypothetical protein NJ76_03205 [Rhodococcus sp. IITR03]